MGKTRKTKMGQKMQGIPDQKPKKMAVKAERPAQMLSLAEVRLLFSSPGGGPAAGERENAPAARSDFLACRAGRVPASGGGEVSKGEKPRPTQRAAENAGGRLRAVFASALQWGTGRTGCGPCACRRGPGRKGKRHMPALTPESRRALPAAGRETPQSGRAGLARLGGAP